MTAILRRAVVVALLAAWTFPAASFARTADPPAAAPPSRPAPVASGSAEAASTAPVPASASQTYAQREKQSRGLEDFRGGEVVGIYIGGGALTVLLFILLIVILV
jgi:uncharacterized ion transporter superfamily protein YfcC